MELRVIVCLTLFLLLLGEKAVSSELRFGFTGPLTGPNALTGTQVVRGIELGFKHINDSQKLNYTLSLVPLDDGYEPSRTASQVTTLIEDYGVKAMLGSYGTPTNLATLGILSKHNIPLISPLSGAQSLRAKRPSPFIFHTRASYTDEAYYLINLLINGLDIKPNEIAIFAQKDSYGDAGVASIMEALLTHGLRDPASILQIRHQRNNGEVSHSVADVLAVFPLPKVIILISTYETSANFIKLLEEYGVSTLFATLSFTGLEAIRSKTADTESELFITQATPSLTDSASPIVKQFKEDMVRYGETAAPTSFQLEGYIIALIVGQALEPFKELPSSKDIEKALKRLAKDSANAQQENELFVFNPNKQHLWVQYIKKGKLEKHPVINKATHH